MTYVFVNKKGLLFSSEKKCPVKGKLKTKYLGFTEKVSNPVKLNTGRLLYL